MRKFSFDTEKFISVNELLNEEETTILDQVLNQMDTIIVKTLNDLDIKVLDSEKHSSKSHIQSKDKNKVSLRYELSLTAHDHYAKMTVGYIKPEKRASDIENQIDSHIHASLRSKMAGTPKIDVQYSRLGDELDVDDIHLLITISGSFLVK